MIKSEETRVLDRVRTIEFYRNGNYHDSVLIFTTEEGYGYSIYGMTRQGSYVEDSFGFDSPAAAESTARDHFDIMRTERPPQSQAEAIERAEAEGKLLRFQKK